MKGEKMKNILFDILFCKVIHIYVSLCREKKNGRIHSNLLRVFVSQE